MEEVKELVRNLYLGGEYVIRHPSLHEEDSPWKVSKIVPLVDRFICHINKKDEINLLDVGGGAGLILYAVSTYIEKSHNFRVNKYVLDLSPSMLEIQKKRNPDLRRALNEDICNKISLGNKEIDLTLLIDVLEHVLDPIEALEEVKRISSFCILKVPLEDSLDIRIWNFVKMGERRKHAIETRGHINTYNFSKLKRQIEKHAGRVLDFYFTNAFHDRRNTEHYKEKTRLISRFRDFIASHIFHYRPNCVPLYFVIMSWSWFSAIECN